MGFFDAIGALFFTTSAKEAEEEKPSNKGIGAEPHNRATVLAIDDDPTLLNVLRATLSSVGYNVLTSTSGPKGLDLLRYSRSVAVVLLDYNMPNFDGCVTLDYIRQLCPATRIIGLTGADTNMIAGRFASGVDKLITKPFRNQELLDTIDLYISAAKASVTGSADPQPN